MSGEKVFQKEGTASAKVLGQKHVGMFETAPRKHSWCRRREDRVRGEGRQWFMQTLLRLAKNFRLYYECSGTSLEGFVLRGDLDK